MKLIAILFTLFLAFTANADFLPGEDIDLEGQHVVKNAVNVQAATMTTGTIVVDGEARLGALSLDASNGNGKMAIIYIGGNVGTPLFVDKPCDLTQGNCPPIFLAFQSQVDAVQDIADTQTFYHVNDNGSVFINPDHCPFYFSAPVEILDVSCESFGPNNPSFEIENFGPEGPRPGFVGGNNLQCGTVSDNDVPLASTAAAGETLCFKTTNVSLVQPTSVRVSIRVAPVEN